MSDIDCFSRIVFEISQLLSLQDLGAISYLYKLPDTCKDLSCQLQVLVDLERRGVFSPSNPEGLKTLLDTIHRSDLSEMVSEYMAMNKRNEESDCFCKQVKTMMKTCNLELCIAQACHLVEQLIDIKQMVATYSNTHRTTPTDSLFYGKVDKTLAQLQNEVDLYMIAPLKGLQKNMGVCLQGESSPSSRQNKQEARKPNDCHFPETQTKSQTPAKIPCPNTISGTAGLSQTTQVSVPKLHSLSDKVDVGKWNDESDYDHLEPVKDSEKVKSSQNITCQMTICGSNTCNGANKKTVPLESWGERSSASYPKESLPARNREPNSRPLTAVSDIPGSPSRRHMSPFNSPLVQRRSVVSRSSDYWECSGDDSGFVDIIEFRNQLDHNLSVSERGHSGSTCSQDKPDYAALDTALTDDAYNDYVQPQPRHRN